MHEITPDVRKRFEEKVDHGSDSECWEWTAARRCGYGVLGLDGTTINAHRLAFIIEHGEEPEDLVLHKCDNPPCCNPQHLYDGTPSENARDWFDRQDAAEKFKNESNPNSSLDRQQVAEIKRRLSSETQSSLAVEFGVDRSTIAHIATGRNWANVDPESHPEDTSPRGEGS